METIGALQDRIADLEHQLAQSERRLAEERRYRQIFETVPIGVAITRASDCSFVEFNDAAARGLGYTREEFARLNVRDLDANEVEPDYPPGGRQAHFETKVKARNGELRNVIITTHPMEIEGELFYCGILQDITERKRVEEAVAQQLSIVQTITETAADAVFMTDAGRKVTFANPAATAMFGYTFEELSGSNLHALIHYQHPDGRPYPGADCPLGAVRRTGRTLRDHRDIFFRKDGTAVHVSVSNAPLVKDGRVVATVVIVRDVTTRERRERELREVHDRLAAALATAELGIWSANFATGELIWDARMKSMFRLAPGEEITRARAISFIHPDDRSRAVAILGSRPESADEFQWKWRLIVNGEIRWHQGRGTFTRDGSGTITGAGGITRDITDQTRDEEVRERFAAIVEGTDDAVSSSTPEGILTSWNRGAERIFGYSAAEMIGDTAARLVPPELAHERQQYLARIATGESIDRYETERVTKDGRRILVALTMCPMRNQEDTIFGYSVIARDITREKLLEEKLRQAEKMEAIGQLAGGIAHDFNNLLTVVNGYASLAQANPASRSLPDYLTEIASAGERAKALTQKLLAFSRKQMLQAQVFDINGVIEAMLPLLSRIIREDIECTTMLSPVAAVMADPRQLEQVVMNLAANASDAMPSGGRIAIETRNGSLEEDRRRHPELAAGDYVMLSVTDTGQGIEPGIVGRIFEPFFTTKPVGKGTGLGLSTVYGIVRQSGGQVVCWSEVGRGTTFRVYLPALPVPADIGAWPPAQTQVESVRGTETILLVEDDAALRRYAVNVLEELGYTVYAAAGGKEALALAEEKEYRIDLLITDVVMPRQSGRELSQALAPLANAMRVLFISGYAENAIVQQGVLEPGLDFLSKPFGPEQLSRKVREVMSAPVRPRSVLFLGQGESGQLRASLTAAGYDVAAVADRAEALSICQNKAVHLMVIDFQTLEETLERVRWCRRQIPNVLILVTGGGGELAKQCGARVVLDDAVGPDEFVAAVRGLIGG